MKPTELGDVEVHRLANGLTVGLLRSDQAPIVSTVVWYRVGTADEGAGEGGAAHFLEHMMFKGSGAYGPGEVDRLTQSLGGVNNAFTSHDATAYYFQFAADCWQTALDIEADRMVGLRLDAREVDHERQVVVEEIAMYESDPWDALELRVHERVYGDHPYGRPVLGTATSLRAIGPDELRSFHRRHYRPEQAVIVVAGAIGDDALGQVERRFGDIPRGDLPDRPVRAAPGPVGEQRLSRRHGDVPRLLWAIPCPAWQAPEHAPLRLLLQALTEGRSSRLHRGLVEEGQLCSWVTGELSANLEPGILSLGLEVVPGVEPETVERRLFELVEAVVEDGLTDDETDRARRTYEADWVFGHERIQQRALSIAAALSITDLEFPFRYRDAVLAAGDRLHDVARYLDPAAGVVGWSLAEGDGA